MNRRKISILMALSLIFTGVTGVRSYASQELNIVEEVLETTLSEESDGLTGEDAGTDQIAEQEEVVSGTYKTTPADGEETDDRPDGVVQTVFKTTPVDENGNDATGTEVQEIVGSSSIPDPSELGLYARDIVNMVMPVIPEDTYNFVMDSQDLLSRYSLYKDSYEKASLYFTNSTGEKSHTCISDVAMAKNKSSVPVLLYVTLQVENENGWPVRYTDMDSVEADTENNISFALVPVSANSVNTVDEALASEEESGMDEPAAEEEYTLCTDRMISIDETGKAEMILYLPGTPDNFDLIGDRYMAKEDAVWSSLGFAVTGACNTKADWSEVDERSDKGEKIGIHISYRMDLLSEEQEELISGGLKPDPETGVIIFDGTEAEDEGNDSSNDDKGSVKEEVLTEDRKEENTEVLKDKENEEYLEDTSEGEDKLTDGL